MTTFNLGIDIGSTTVKLVVTDSTVKPLFSRYSRHNTRVIDTLVSALWEVHEHFPSQNFVIAFTGSAGMGIAERTNSLFIQEIIAATGMVQHLYPDVKTIIDIGGEDAKLVLLDNPTNPDIRMNGNCAGGTGAYIDQMAALLNVPIEQLNDWAENHTRIYPVASRCGVFAKTDVQNLISRKIEPQDIAASIFEAVANQTLNTLARGCHLNTQLLVCGGPLTYIPFLRTSFSKALHISPADLLIPDHGALFTALGTAFSIPHNTLATTIPEFIAQLSQSNPIQTTEHHLSPLFGGQHKFDAWEQIRNLVTIPQNKITDSKELFLGIDSGSTTTKMVVLNENKEMVFHFYKHNNGDPLQIITQGLLSLFDKISDFPSPPIIVASSVTGYGEELIHNGLGIDFGIVETVAHTLAAQQLDPEVTFVLDIGGQDMKAIFIQQGTITNIEINEACSSGCGTFIEGFANTLGYSSEAFAQLAVNSQTPYDLGSRCTVFMNSKVKQALRDGASVEDLSAGLAYSVIKNCLHKVLRIQSNTDIGNTVVVQGGTFKNSAVFRSLEILSGKKVVISDFPELMGAYGAAIYAFDKKNTLQKSGFVGFDHLQLGLSFQSTYKACMGCSNRCMITKYHFNNGNSAFAGNKCEKIFSNSGEKIEKGENLFDLKWSFFHDRKSVNKHHTQIGLPLILNMYENYPFWHTLFTESGFQVVPSDDSTQALYQKGIGGAMSDNICFPAKLAHGHIENLIEKRVDRIFLPMVVYEQKKYSKSTNSFNCPVVTGYPEVLKSGVMDRLPYNMAIDTLPISFQSEQLLWKACRRYLKGLGVTSSVSQSAFQKAIQEQARYKTLIVEANEQIIQRAIKSKKPIVMVAGHPYHIDPLIHQKVSQILSDLGVCVINEEILAHNSDASFDAFFTISQWEYTNRILQATKWITEQPYEIGMVQLNSFGCGLDSIILSEIKQAVNQKQIPYAWVRIDEISSPGSVKLRLRSLVESMKMRNPIEDINTKPLANQQRAIFEEKDKHRTILFPWFSDFYSPLAPILAKQVGYNFENLPPSDQESIDLGLKFANNEVCYPATLVVGDVIKALQSGKYKAEDIAIGITQTGGQCRATNYLSLIKRAMANAGFDDIPIIGLGSPDAIFNLQPGFQPKWLSIIRPTFSALLFADAISKLYYATASREETNVQSKILKEKYIKLAQQVLENKKHNQLIPLLEQAVQEFNQVPVKYHDVKTVGLVGEIYVKYNAHGQYYIIDWLIENHIEVEIPPLMEFMMQAFVNTKAQHNDFIAPKKGLYFIDSIMELYANRFIGKFEKVLQKFKYYKPAHSIHHAAQLASEILNLNHQYGEGWLIPAEIATFASRNINDVVCLQPFGCIANHIIGKGMEKKIKQKYPQLNLLYLDFDSGISKVNVLNRLHFLLQNN
jgi:predicted CoA-substrate-specific enzyme activase